MMPLDVHDFAQLLADAVARAQAPTSDFDLNKGLQLPAGRKLTPAAVLIAFRADTGALILTKRSAHLNHHPGQIAFPGGKQDATDASPQAAALREAWEEIGLDADQVTTIGQLLPHETVTSYAVHPIVALTKGKTDYIAEKGEVSEIFEVPFEHVMSVENYRVESRIWQGQRRYFYVVPYGPYYIWGATARMLRALAESVSK